MENFANLMLCLCHKQSYLMDQFLRAKQEKFVKEGGFKENLYKKRMDFKRSQI
jgi:four helix bundle suffix protein